MGTLGNQPNFGAYGFTRTQAESFNGTGSATSFTLGHHVKNAIDIEVLVDNVQQSPFDGSYSVSGTTLTFSGAPASGTNNVYVMYRQVGTVIDTQALIPDDSSVTYAKLGNDIPLGNRNLIINGAMQVAQRGTSNAITGGGYHTIDRWSTVANSGMSYAVTMSQESTDSDTNGFGYSLKLLTTTAQSMTGGQNYSLRYQIEGRDIKHFSYGTVSAKVITLSFWVKSNKTGLFSLQIYNGNTGTNHSMLTSYTVNVADTWEYKTIAIPANTSQVMNRTEAMGMMLDFNLASGPDDIVSAFDWGLNYNGAARAVTGQVNILDTVNNYFQITGVQLEAGTKATPFEHRSNGDELAKCQRYYQQYGFESGAPFRINGSGNGSNTMLTGFMFQYQMRSAPSINYFGSGSDGGNFNVYVHNTAQGNSSPTSADIGTRSVRWNFSGNGSYPNGAYWIDVGSGSNQMAFTLDAEL